MGQPHCEGAGVEHVIEGLSGLLSPLTLYLDAVGLAAHGVGELAQGRTYKELVPVESGDPEVEIEREVLRTSVVALDLRTGRFEVVQQGGSLRPSPP